MIELPPLLAGAANDTTSGPVAVLVEPVTAFTPVGRPGTVAGTKLFDAADAPPVPTAFVAVTRQVNVLPFVRPDTTIGLEAPVLEPVTVASADTHVAV